MKSALYAVVLTAVVVFCCFEATTCSTTASPISSTIVTVTTGKTIDPPVFTKNTTDNGTTATTHTMAPTESSTSGKTTLDITSVTIQPHTGSDTTLSFSTTNTAQTTGSSGSNDSVTTMPPIPTTPCPHPTGFDAASFVGGIILALGVMVILVIVVKCYQHHKSKSELQYSQF